MFLDESAMVAAGRGNVLASRLIHRTHAEPDCFPCAAVCALAEADRTRPGHSGAHRRPALPGITIVDLDLPSALSVARATTWADAHTLYAPSTPPSPAPTGRMAR